jgi:predicted transcriptional regulator
MGKTITVRVDDSTYKKLKTAADAERRTISNFIENASLSYIDSTAFVENDEMENILDDKELLKELNGAMDDIKRGKYQIIR